MQTIFTYGSRKSGITPKTILFGDLRTYTPNKVYEVENYIGTMPISPLGAAELLAAGNEAAIKVKISEIKAYRIKSVAWYDQRVSKNSGGKQQNYRDNRAAVNDGLDISLDILTRGLIDLQNRKVAELDAKLPPAPVVLPDGTVVQPESKASGSDLSKFILPIGAGLAALFFLKGH